MPITQEEAKLALGASPKEKAFAQAAGTLKVYENVNQKLGALQGVIGSIYGPQNEWNPTAVVGAIKNYSAVVRDLIGQTRDMIKIDPLLGPAFADYLADRSDLVTVYKNMARPWLNYIRDSTVYGKVQSGMLEEAARERKNAAAKQIPELAKLMSELNNING